MGTNTGGIVENTEIVKTNLVPVDAFTGATNTVRPGFNVGAHVAAPFLLNSVETGVDVMTNNHVFTFKDAINNYNGNRKIDLYQFMLPLTYNFGFFKKNNPLGAFQIRIGGVLQYNLLYVKSNGALPDYTFKPFSAGATLGFKLIPFHFNNQTYLGFYLDGYRGSRIYEDFYNQSSFQMPGSSYLKWGILFQF